MARARSAALLLLALLLVCSGAASVAAAAAGKIKGKAAAGSGRAEAECRDLATRRKCVAIGGGGRCRWCRSEALDDMCFGAAEAWRLPKQVFSCDQPAGAAHSRR